MKGNRNMKEHKYAVVTKIEYSDFDGFPVRVLEDIYYLGNAEEARAFYDMIKDDKLKIVTHNNGKHSDAVQASVRIDLQFFEGGKWKLVKRTLDEFSYERG